jgi:hypothetical protein
MLVAAMSGSTRPAYAAFHCMRIHAVMAGFDGNDDLQFVELRMNSGGQTVLGGHKMRFFDAAGTQTAEFTFPSGVTNGLKGESVLIATAEFNNDWTPGGNADFEFSLANTTGTTTDNRLHPVQYPGGKVIFEPNFAGCVSGPPVDSLAYDPAATVPPDFGSRAAALPSPSTNLGLQLDNLALAPSDNSTEYDLMPATNTGGQIEPVAATLEADKRFPRNNKRTLLDMEPPTAVGGSVTEPELAEDALPAPDRAGDDGSMAVQIAAVTASVLAAAAALGALEVRRRRRA